MRRAGIFLLLVLGFLLYFIFQEKRALKENVEAARRYRIAAENGDVTAQVQIGLSYAEGKGVPKDDVEAVKWFRIAIAHGSASARFHLGLAYARGKGVPKDDLEGLKWIRKAAENGDINAHFYFGLADAGTGWRKSVLSNKTEAVRWFSKASEQGIVSAQFCLGLAYATGEGVHQDSAVGYMSNLHVVAPRPAADFRAGEETRHAARHESLDDKCAAVSDGWHGEPTAAAALNSG